MLLMCCKLSVKVTTSRFFYRSTNGQNLQRILHPFVDIWIIMMQHESLTLEALVDERDASTSFAVQHVRNVKFPCPNCTSVFNRKNNLQKHLKYECGQLPRFKCPHCEYRSKKTSNVRAHIRSIHYGSIIYVIDLKSSYLEHLGGFKIPCNVMSRPAEFQDRNQDRFPCPKCTSTFNRKNNLYSHLKFECGQLPRFGCPYCDYASKKSSNIRAHVRRKHHGYKVNVINVSRNATCGTATEDENSEKIEQTI